MSKDKVNVSGLSPLKYGAFRALWIAAVASNIGSLMQAVGEGWLMTSLTSSSLLVALTYSSESISIVLLALPAGALADIVNRRWLLITSQAWMLATAATLGVITMLGLISPLTLLLFIFLIGLGEAMSTPAFAPYLLGTVPHNETRNAVTLIGVALNIGRGLGPAVGGILVAFVGPAAVFFLNAGSFAGVIVILYRFRSNAPSISQLPAERMIGAIRAGMRYVRYNYTIHTVLARVAALAIPISALPALLPAFVRHDLGLDSSVYGILFGLFGLGAIIGGLVIMPKIIRKVSADWIAVIATISFLVSLAALATVQNIAILASAMVLAGIAQIMAFATLGFVLYGSLPNWVIARAASFYQLVLQAALVAGSVAWGLIADQFGISTALLSASAALAVGLLVKLRYPLKADKEIDVSASMHWPIPQLLSQPNLDQGPVLVQIEYKIDPSKLQEFTKAMQDLSTIRKRDGAFYWGLFRHDKNENVFVESFLVDSWVEHLRQHERMTVADRFIEERAKTFHIDEKPPNVSHFIAGPFQSDSRRTHDGDDGI
jgi:MFS family permease/quinol monooxygenase YgiN